MPHNGYATCIWIFFIPFVLVEIPSNLIMSLPRVKPNLFLGSNMLILGVISTCQGLTQTYRGLLALRFLMGILEATLPAGKSLFLSVEDVADWLGAALLIGEYYTRKQASLRYAYFFCFALLGPAISGVSLQVSFAVRQALMSTVVTCHRYPQHGRYRGEGGLAMVSG